MTNRKMMAGRCTHFVFAPCLATLCCGCHSHKWLGMTSKSEHNRQALPAYGMGISSDLCGLTLEISSECNESD